MRHTFSPDVFFSKYFIVFFSVLLISGDGLCEQKKQYPSSTSNTITLNQAVEIALKNNRSLQRSHLSLSSSELNVESRQDDFDIKIVPESTVGFSSLDYQYLSAGVKFSKKTEVGISGSITPQVERDNDINRTSINLSLNVPLLRLGTEYNLDGLYSSLYELEAARMSYYKQQDSLVVSTISTVYDVINFQKQINLLNTQLVGLKKYISLTELKEKTGLASAMDMYRAELRLKDVQNELTIIIEQYESRIDSLKKLLGTSVQGDLTVRASTDYEPVNISLEKAVTIALGNRIEIEQSRRKVEELKRKVSIARRDILPIIDFNLGYKKYVDNSPFLEEEDWVVSLNGSSDLFRSAEKTAFEQANIRLQQSKIDQESIREDIIKEVRGQLNQMKKKEKLIADRGEQARQAKGKLELAFSKFNHQLANNFDLLEAQTQKQQVETELLFDTIGYTIDTYRLRSVLGTLIER